MTARALFKARSYVSLLLLFFCCLLYSINLADGHVFESLPPGTTSRLVDDDKISLFQQEGSHHVLDDTQRPLRSQNQAQDLELPSHYLNDFMDALKVMQGHFFEVWLGIWPQAIDWTAAVMGTHVSASLSALTQSSSFNQCATSFDSASENVVNGYFSHLTSFYFGENAFSIRGQAYDDMLWVVLGWLESIKFIELHSRLHFSTTDDGANSTWYAKHFIPAYAHRARIFWDLASNGWDTTLCGGGMIWNPYLTPYKNAITNQLYIAASVSMYLYFPGDNNSFPFIAEQDYPQPGIGHAKKHDKKYLKAACDAYTWIMNSNMTNSHGLFIDGFHISHRHEGPDFSEEHWKCDVPDKMVYTYNQGVILTGQRGLWEATGSKKYLEDGHKLIDNVIRATGWPTLNGTDKTEWAGLGRNGILEEACDSSGSCSQNGQTFKGIFFHHLTAFCAPLLVGVQDGVFHKADPVTAAQHRLACLAYVPWIEHNVKAALKTKDEHGKFGTWWTYGLLSTNDGFDSELYPAPSEGTDYRNDGVPHDNIWMVKDGKNQDPTSTQMRRRHKGGPRSPEGLRDPNNRGRGRTVETQSGGLAVLRALYKIAGLNRS